MSETPDHTRPSGADATAATRRTEGDPPALFKRVAWQAAFAIGGFLLACHVWLVRLTNRLVRVPAASFHEPWDREPAIIAVWHGEHFLLPFVFRRTDKVNVMVTLHRDGEIITWAGVFFSLKYIRGSGDHGKEFMRKRAVRAFATMLRLLKRGENVAMTADVPKVARVAGLGIVTLAKHSGCPIVPVGMGTSRRFRLSNWDRTCINLPFGRMVTVRGEPIRVARDADDAALEAARRTVEERLIDADARAYAIADGRHRPEQLA
jgi:lysophospholipid acyltransferase (LPLAT)-like uncharacterized protein